ncbi:hypothetical protein [Chromatium okenii]|jgi:hypothetical protein|uniref:DUF1640 domain-containing protein n=1 Tax=Chromatium okenii TaxID=61644 RepID=A0A2S7XMF9_9GAMM|nr:hypothetical protein [Chromatium okenii]PQJ94919.1 hypothetical protein CXB77_17490 [Chromatium okenii]
MNTIVLDTLDYATKLKAGGFTEQQAETSARLLAEVLEQQVVTKAQATEHDNNLRRDIEVLRVELKHDIENVRIELKRDVREAELKLEARISESKAELTRWVIGAGLLQTTVIIGVLMKVAKLI